MQQQQKTKFSKTDGDRLVFPPKNKKMIRESNTFPLLLHLEFTTVHNIKNVQKTRKVQNATSSKYKTKYTTCTCTVHY